LLPVCYILIVYYARLPRLMSRRTSKPLIRLVESRPPRFISIRVHKRLVSYPACRIRSSRHYFCFIGCATIRGLCVVLVACLAGNYCFIDVFSTFFNSFNAHIHLTPFQNLKSKRFFMNGKFNFNNFLFYNFFFICL
jgi:hypothetical protein